MPVISAFLADTWPPVDPGEKLQNTPGQADRSKEGRNRNENGARTKKRDRCGPGSIPRAHPRARRPAWAVVSTAIGVAPSKPRRPTMKRSDAPPRNDRE